MLQFQGYKIEAGSENKASTPHVSCKVFPLFHCCVSICAAFLERKTFNGRVRMFCAAMRCTPVSIYDICTHKHTHTHTTNVLCLFQNDSWIAWKYQSNQTQFSFCPVYFMYVGNLRVNMYIFFADLYLYIEMRGGRYLGVYVRSLTNEA